MAEKTLNCNKHITTLWGPYSKVSEQYSELRTYILKEGKNKTSRVFLISSALHGEGKTLTSINLAISIVRGLHETVLLIDADLRKPTISPMLGLEKDIKGLAEYLAFGGDLADFITKTSIPKLSIIASGQPPANPSELLGSEYMFNLIKEVKHRYDNRYIIIDSPPLIPVVDTTILSNMAGGVIIVVKASSTQRKLVNEAIDKIKNKKKILGLVINGNKNTLTQSKYNNTYYC